MSLETSVSTCKITSFSVPRAEFFFSSFASDGLQQCPKNDMVCSASFSGCRFLQLPVLKVVERIQTGHHVLLLLAAVLLL